MLKRKDTIVAKMAKSSTRKMNDDGDLGGFTIIEVVLVLAIAGLIFLMVFIALPALQRAQRDSQRRTDLGRVTQAILNYQGNNNGRLPSNGKTEQVKEDEDGRVDLVEYNCVTGTAGAGGESAQYKSTEPVCKLILEYMNGAGAQYSEWVDPDGYGYGLTITSFDELGKETPTLVYDDHMVYVVKGTTCNGEELVESNNSRDYSVMYRLEGAGVYCQSNG